jgi:hypothetical protein
MIEALKERVNDDTALVRRGRYLTTTFLLEVGPTAWLISIFEGRIVSVTPGSNDLMALIRRRVLKAEGDLQIFMAHLRYFKEALAKLRPGVAA